MIMFTQNTIKSAYLGKDDCDARVELYLNRITFIRSAHFELVVITGSPYSADLALSRRSISLESHEREDLFEREINRYVAEGYKIYGASVEVTNAVEDTVPIVGCRNIEI